MKVTEIAFCCYAVTDIKRSREFYEGVLGLKPTTVHEGRWIEYEFGPYALAIGCWPGMSVVPDGDDFRSRQQHDLYSQVEGKAAMRQSGRNELFANMAAVAKLGS